jgi:hypothetical protein
MARFKQQKFNVCLNVLLKDGDNEHGQQLN